MDPVRGTPGCRRPQQAHTKQTRSAEKLPPKKAPGQDQHARAGTSHAPVVGFSKQLRRIVDMCVSSCVCLSLLERHSTHVTRRLSCHAAMAGKHHPDYASVNASWVAVGPTQDSITALERPVHPRQGRLPLGAPQAGSEHPKPYFSLGPNQPTQPEPAPNTTLMIRSRAGP